MKTVADPWTTFIYDRQQNEALTPSATKGTPRLSVLAMMEGAFPASAKAYNVREAIYRSELDADITNNRIHAFKKPGRTRNVNLFAMRAIVTWYLGILNCHHERRCSRTGVLISAPRKRK